MRSALSGLAAAGLSLLLVIGGSTAAGVVEYDLSAPSGTLGRPIPYAVYKPFPHPPEGTRWPVVYLLHGHTGKDGDWFTWGDLGPILDRAIADGRIPPLIVVAPGFGDSWYVDNSDPGGFGPVATAISADLIPAIDSTLPTAPCREGRAIGGLSMGGAGAVLQGINQPESFVAVMSFSGALHMPLVDNDPRLRWIPSLYSDVFGEPFDPRRFNAANAFNRVNRLRAAPERPSFYQTIGDRDFPDLIEAAAQFHNRLRAIEVDTTLRVTSGEHYWHTWQQAIVPAIEWLAPRLDATCGQPRR